MAMRQSLMPLCSQALGMLLRNRLYIGVIDVPDFSIRDQHGDFDPLISEETFCKAQAVLSSNEIRWPRVSTEFHVFSYLPSIKAGMKWKV